LGVVDDPQLFGYLLSTSNATVTGAQHYRRSKVFLAAYG
jgi:hypothetical protein